MSAKRGPDSVDPAQKVCPIVFRRADGAVQLLAFKHPTAGNQFVKGTIEEGEPAAQAARRELREESGIRVAARLIELGRTPIGEEGTVWHFFAAEGRGLPLSWDHRTEDDHGHVFLFFWHPLADDLDEDWHPPFHEALEAVRRWLPV